MENKKKLDGKSVSRVLDEYIKRSGCNLNEISSKMVMNAVQNRDKENYGHRQINRIRTSLALSTPYKIEFKGENNLNISSVYLVPYTSKHMSTNAGEWFSKYLDLNESHLNNLGLANKGKTNSKGKKSIDSVDFGDKRSQYNTFDIYVKENDDENITLTFKDVRKALIDHSSKKYNISPEKIGEIFLRGTNEYESYYTGVWALHKGFEGYSYFILRFDNPTDCRKWVSLVQNIFDDLWGIKFEIDWHLLMM